MEHEAFPETVLNWIDGQQVAARSGAFLNKLSPHDGRILSRAARSDGSDIQDAVNAAGRARKAWAETPPVKRGLILHEIVNELIRKRETVAEIVALETGKSPRDARGETDGAIQLGLFYASEGQRLYGRTSTSGTPHKYAMTIRQPVGIAGLIIAANTPIANVAWKVFPALICGNAVILKSAEDTPLTAWIFGRIAHDAGLPAGVLNIVSGFGPEAGGPLVDHPEVGVISFTGSTEVGRMIAVAAGRRLARVSLELGGKNPLLVCADANLEQAAKWILLSAFSNAGQRCAAGSRIIVCDAVYDKLRAILIERTGQLKVGNTDGDDFGPVINRKQLDRMVDAITAARERGAVVLTGGMQLAGDRHQNGCYMAPTLIENVGPEDAISTSELFGPIACLYRVRDYAGALALANDSPYGLTACIHTGSVDRAIHFTQHVRAGVAVVNAGTYGSEPHMPFGGFKQSGNGSREPGTEALDVYSELKDIYLNVDPNRL
jgi:alpha-ketoglutaric semialdehyde dehydrogenase